jgi:hypothetical protein
LKKTKEWEEKIYPKIFQEALLNLCFEIETIKTKNQNNKFRLNHEVKKVNSRRCRIIDARHSKI